MQYHLDTIPLWEVMQGHCQCPFCALQSQSERQEVQCALGEKVMEPASRIRFNELGICAKHHCQLLEQNNRLGHALLTDSHCRELLPKLDHLSSLAQKGRKGISPPWSGSGSSPMDTLLKQLEQCTVSCVICDSVNTHMDRYFHTFLHLWKTDVHFKTLWEASQGACMPHTIELLRKAKKSLHGSRQQELASSALALLKASMTREEEELAFFTQQFDYRNHGRPWGDSKNALERTVKRLRGGFDQETYTEGQNEA